MNLCKVASVDVTGISHALHEDEQGLAFTTYRLGGAGLPAFSLYPRGAADDIILAAFDRDPEAILVSNVQHFSTASRHGLHKLLTASGNLCLELAGVVRSFQPYGQFSLGSKDSASVWALKQPIQSTCLGVC